MATPRMDVTSFVGKVLEQDDVDALREGVRVLTAVGLVAGALGVYLWRGYLGGPVFVACSWRYIHWPSNARDASRGQRALS